MTNAKRPQGMNSPLFPKVLKYMAKVHVAAYRRTNGRIGKTWRIGAAFRKPLPVLLLDHVGRKSGKQFTTPLVFMPDGGNTIVVASQGGLPKNPQWYSNLMANPDTQIQLEAEHRKVRARTADAAERADLWPRLVEVYADYANYQSWTEREIPVVILEPR